MTTKAAEMKVTTEQMLRRAFPNGISKDEYYSLIWVLDEAGMSHRSIATAMEASSLECWPTAYHDVLGVLYERAKYVADGQRMIEKLKSYGYDDWIERLHEPL